MCKEIRRQSVCIEIKTYAQAIRDENFLSDSKTLSNEHKELPTYLIFWINVTPVCIQKQGPLPSRALRSMKCLWHLLTICIFEYYFQICIRLYENVQLWNYVRYYFKIDKISTNKIDTSTNGIFTKKENDLHIMAFHYSIQCQLKRQMLRFYFYKMAMLQTFHLRTLLAF